ncbi:response regulator transcription factor [Lachnotalea sp. AF33-28]|uniref:response regulator transcription factor n=1 Tax=Lachnotalea sp. AF33-28 TaxID=2292046 RepID=UPI000E47EE74|nr:response regulator [Lachnotalea sp. AF33-28]RHP35673.1 response regulator [Lachnotalea sp. AF33-28]
MFRVIAVDDEAIVRIAMQNIIKWEEYDMTFVGIASNGKRALELVAEKQPDIIITDLVMNEMDGIALIRELKARGYDGRIIVLSNYSEFEMVREAMKMGAFDYILKNSLIGANLLEVLEAAKKELAESRKRRAEPVLEAADATYQYGSITRQIRRYLQGDSYDRDLLEKNFPVGRYCMLYLICGDVHEGAENEKENFVSNIIEEVLGDPFYLCTVHIINGNNAVIGRAELLDSVFLLEKMLSSIKVYTNCSYTVYASGAFTSYQEMRPVFESLWELSKHAYYQERTQPVTMASEKRERFPEFSRELKLDIRELLLRGVSGFDEEGLKTVLEEIGRHCRETYLDPDLLKKWLEVGLAQTAAVLDFSGELNSEELGRWYLKIQNAVSLTQTMQLLEETCLYLRSAAGQKKTSYEVRVVLDYIEAHYQEKLSLDFLAGYVNFSPSYLTRVFKKETGKTISDYVNEYKINKAAELLTCQDLLVKEAAGCIGIDDQYYFSKLFKKYKGETPSQYYSRIHSR